MDAFDLERFARAQDPVYTNVLQELRQGDKRSHWMWFVFPQLRGLGSSEMAQRYAISGRDEARAFLAHTSLGARLLECTQGMNALEGKFTFEILGSPDDQNFHSSMTLFAAIAEDPAPFVAALEKYFGGRRDSRTLELLT